MLATPGLTTAHMDDRLTCDPAGFRMSRVAVPGPASTTAYQYRMTGTLQVPTPGYGYALLPGTRRSASGLLVHHLRLVLTPPAGMTMQVISELTIDTGFQLPHPDAERVIVSIEKPFDWGPGQIVCVVPFE
jgi:hypothetical protein